ncbi:hypothetical protein CVT26_013778 [Gymnopilus dilepis]|uniref:Uncharacterized protein n=1 Tax=Gymnopilus dilepis TaxID=231916 RepID=A0A409Y6D3_9AGAR|nr:hypothetical protein CVT26_013778 [Gymnopilus dilepis]
MASGASSASGIGRSEFQRMPTGADAGESAGNSFIGALSVLDPGGTPLIYVPHSFPFSFLISPSPFSWSPEALDNTPPLIGQLIPRAGRNDRFVENKGSALLPSLSRISPVINEPCLQPFLVSAKYPGWYWSTRKNEEEVGLIVTGHDSMGE